LDLVCGLDGQEGVESLFRGHSAPFDLVDFVRLELRKGVAQVVEAALIDRLQLLINERCLRVPLQLGILLLLRRLANLRGPRLCALGLELFRLLPRIVQLLGHC
jgi:hypothetical protein